ncbi:universal stress protein [Streptomyces sp. NBC_00038]|uniref:universal stress protein n=1 Tax=Streptomyces sp. NBC_00038 TaxID=2903615 RepID=UPI00225590A5|nr:universal stress protein [Streptomyces sp. NBC_00038]MCX5554648.1 universal stress protein [Streptomyces sp. NBC_00038]
MRQRVIVGVDGSRRSLVAADWAAREAALRRLPLRLVHVSPFSDEELAALWPYRPLLLPSRAVTELTARHPAIHIEGQRLSGEPVPVLLGMAGAQDVVVLGIRSAGGFAGQPLGSVAQGMIESSPHPVVLVPGGLAWDGPERGRRPDRVTLGIDAHAPADGAIDFAFDAAQRRNARLHVIHAWSLPPAADRMSFAVPEKDRATWEDQEVQVLSDALRPWREKYPNVRVLEDVVLFSAADALVRASARTELLVVGRATAALGPAVHALVRHARCPVAVVPS